MLYTALKGADAQKKRLIATKADINAIKMLKNTQKYRKPPLKRLKIP